jgi:hypothetical protein
MTLITLSSTESEFETNYVNPIIINDYSKCALLGATLWYSWYNVSQQFDNNKLAYFNPDSQEWVTLELRDGLYDAETLNYYLLEYFGVNIEEQCPFVFDVNTASNRFMVKIGMDGYKVKFIDDLSKLLGFDKDVELSERINTGKYRGDITRGVDGLLIYCSLVDGSYQNERKSDVIYSFCPDVEPGSVINIEPMNVKYLPLTVSNYIFGIRIKVTDQDNRLIDFNGEKMVIVLDIQ